MRFSNTKTTGEKRVGGKLENWVQIHLSETDSVFTGDIYGDAYWRDGEFLRTSLIVALREGEVETLNTVYQLGNQDNIDDEKRARMTERYKQAFGYE
jgi:hypothetical protein